MLNEYIIENVAYFSQRDNQYIDKENNTNVANISCFPTSLAMCIDYCLILNGQNKTSIGCPDSMQLEDYINQLIDDSDTLQWMKNNNGILGNWIWKYKKRTIYQVETYIFNRLMTEQGYKATFISNLDFNAICDKLEQTKFPIVIGGNFSEISQISGHMLCLVGFNREKQTFILNDPYGNVLTKYSDQNGEKVEYSYKYFIKDTNKHYIVSIEKL